MGTSIFTNDHILSELWIPKRIVWIIWNQKMSKIPSFSSFVAENLYKSTEYHKNRDTVRMSVCSLHFRMSYNS